MVLIETSAWVEFLRRTGSSVNRRVRELVRAGGPATCDPVRLEILGGARSEDELVRLEQLLARAVALPTDPFDYDRAASLYRTCRREGETVRSFIDCLVAAVAVRHGVPVLHADRDFDALARHTALRVEQP